YARRLYEALGRPQPLPEPTTPAEMSGQRPPDYERRLANAQAAIGLRQLRRLRPNLRHREAMVAAYARRLEKEGLELPRMAPGRKPAYVRLPLVVQDRSATIRNVAPHAVLGTWFTSVLEESSSSAAGDYRMGSCPVAEAAAEHLVNLPTHPRTRPFDVEAIISALMPFAPKASVRELQNPRLK
ncbi:MAG: DegT/DnrJ/EryC1/StrS family aminotransferase, partial [Actinomycetota bacterium]|nr:DegT/DnrJ/EryC1/StrS family aminotransferase [Actinomycetota bacterium]